MIKLRPYQSSDCKELSELFYNTVHTINRKDYTPEQLDAWANGHVDLATWDASFLAHHTVVAEEDGRLIGFGDMDQNGYLDRLYVHKDYQGRGIAKALCDCLENRGREVQKAGGCFTTHASITARPFFERRGYQTVKEQQVGRRGQKLTNYVMEKLL